MKHRCAGELVKLNPQETQRTRCCINGRRRVLVSLMAALGIAIVSASAPTVAQDRDQHEEAAKPKKIRIPLEELPAAIQALGEKLGHETFKVRRDATARLIQIGQGRFSEDLEKDEALNLVLKAAKALEKSKDPEVSNRAKQVIDALTPKKPAQTLDNDGGLVIEIE